ncbi:hypothetical protein NHQ30_000105 [Ciborinia camelliae]|nr:hypothetical protein NHQ30_000105 [Ciborinia camelliae]
MRFSDLLPLLLIAPVAVARPIARPEPKAANKTNLITSAPTYVDTWAYTQAITMHSGLTKDNWYYFILEWPLGTTGGKEYEAEIKQLRQQLGFDHIGIVIGRITETEQKSEEGVVKIIRNFAAVTYHMTASDSGKTNVTPQNFDNYYEGQTLKWGGATTPEKAASAKTTAEGYTEQDGHWNFSINDNNCDTFVKVIERIVESAEYGDVSSRAISSSSSWISWRSSGFSDWWNSSVPWPESTFIIRSTSSGKLLTLNVGRVVLTPAGANRGSSIHWRCVEEKGWLHFQNVASGCYLGYNTSRDVICSATRPDGWERIVARPTPSGGYYLLMTHWERLWRVGAQGENLVKIGEGWGEVLVWEFVKV